MRIPIQISIPHYIYSNGIAKRAITYLESNTGENPTKVKLKARNHTTR